MFVSAVRSSGDLAGVFEHDGETGYFYLCDQSRPGAEQVLDAIHVVSGCPDFSEDDVEVRWSRDEEVVGLFVRRGLWAAFRGREKHGGDYRSGGRADIPEAVVESFRAG
jgi:hypothetical protein